jgi:pyrroloquinoline quinone biosynthesis protein D
VSETRIQIEPEATVEIAPNFRFQWEEAQNCHVLLYPEGMITLNDSAGEILKRCDGSRSVDALIDELKQQFPDADLESDGWEFLEEACHAGWIRTRKP